MSIYGILNSKEGTTNTVYQLQTALSILSRGKVG
ncbi:MAG: hypothetical protein ISS10_01800 [Candidatus Marinimicrobia bacterium]|nr:hypothetical protein [Candidatus Neomarinimicrobiota bacterium]MBL7059713.1 hypothetical protein [Candidatus Neomarinimicrobiota bacterium]